MTEEEKFLEVNECETPEELENAIIKIADDDGIIRGRRYEFDSKQMSKMVIPVIEGVVPPNFLTRNYGIRQQALYLKFYLGK